MQLKASNCNFLNETQIITLNKLNIFTIEQFVSHADLDSLSRNSKIPLEQLKLTYKYLVGQYAALAQTGNDLFQKYIRNVFIIKTGCKNIDNLLNGGIYSGEITEIYGQSNCGKTVFCLNIAANLLLTLKSAYLNDTSATKDKNFNNKFNILYIDSCNSFCSDSFKTLLKSIDKTLSNEQLNNLVRTTSVVRCKDLFHLMDILYMLEKEAKVIKQQANSTCKNHLIVKYLLIIDNFNILFNMLRNGNSAQNELLSHLHYITRHLKYLADYLNIAILIVNTTSYEKYTFNSTWSSLPSIRILLSKQQQQQQSSNDKNEFLFQLIKHTRMPSSSSLTQCKFEITSSGIKEITSS